MESNVLRWNYHTTTANNPNALTILIEGRPLSLFLGYRVASDAHLFNRDFSSFFKCILMINYLGVDFGDTRRYTKGLNITENLYNLEFKVESPFSPIMCIRGDTVLYLTKSIQSTFHENTPITIHTAPSLGTFVDRMDFKLIIDFLIGYTKQPNLKIFGHLIVSIVKGWTDAYKERDTRESAEQFFKRISPSVGDFFLYHSLVDYVYSLPM
jgi:hypothetical protein